MYNFTFDFNRTEVSPLKEKDANKIKGLLGGIRCYESFAFEGYGTITFDEADVKHENPMMEVSPEYNRKVNSVVYEIVDKNITPDYDRLVVYTYIGNTVDYYGYVLFNSTTGKSVHKHFIDLDQVDLAKHINEDMMHIPITRMYLTKYDIKMESKRKKKVVEF